MSTRREVCAVDGCGHDKTSHFRIVKVTGTEQTIVWSTCLARWCGCTQFTPEPRSKP